MLYDQFERTGSGLRLRGTRAAAAHDSLTGSLGVQLDTRIDLENGRVLTPFARVAWVHEFETDRDISGFLTNADTVTFTTPGITPGEDLARVNAGFLLDLTGRVGVFAYFDGEFSDSSQTYTSNGGIRISW